MGRCGAGASLARLVPARNPRSDGSGADPKISLFQASRLLRSGGRRAGSLTASVTNYAYDYLNRLSSTTDALSGVTSFTYDLNNRLTNLRDPVNNDTTWAYDNAGRVTMETNELNNTRSFFHDAAGNLTRKKDRNERVTQYTFDDLDRMTAEKWLDRTKGTGPYSMVKTASPFHSTRERMCREKGTFYFREVRNPYL